MALLIVVASPATGDEQSSFEALILYAGNNPPINYEENGKATGLSVDLLLRIFERLQVANTREDIVVVPWARGYSEVQYRKNTMLFAVARTPEREHLFKWAGPIGNIKLVVLARRGSRMVLDQPTPLKDYKYGVTQNSFSEQTLLAGGVPANRMVHLMSVPSALTMLVRGRFDAWVREKMVVSWALEEYGYSAANFVIVRSFDVYARYYAFHRDTDDALVRAVQRELDSLRRDGTIAELTAAYTGQMPPMIAAAQ